MSSPGSKMPEVISNVRCGVDGTMMLTDTGRLFACGRYIHSMSCDLHVTYVAHVHVNIQIVNVLADVYVT